MPPSKLTREDFVGFAEIAKANRAVTVNMFTGTTLKFGAAGVLGSSKELATSSKTVISNAKTLAKGENLPVKAASAPGVRDAVKAFVAECGGVDGIEDLAEAIAGETLKTLVTEALPFVGVVVSGAKLILAGKVVAEDGYNLYKSSEYSTGFRAGDPETAAASVIEIIKRDLATNSIKLGVAAVDTGAKIAGLFADGGTATNAAVSMAKAVATIGLELYALGQAVADMKAGNKLLAAPTGIDLRVFSACPILGCYLITCADTSQIANMFVADIGLPGWMDRIERMKKTKMDPMIKIAEKAIAASKLQLEGLRSDKGTHSDKGFFAKLKSRVVAKVMGKDKGPKVDKSRITGHGSG